MNRSKAAPAKSNPTREKRSSAGFWIAFVLLMTLCAILLELCKNTLWGWGIFVLAAGGFLAVRRRFRANGRWRGLLPILCWVLLPGLLTGNLILTGPPRRAVPAVDGQNGGITPAVTVRQGALTGVYTKDGAVAVYAGIPYAAPPVGALRWQEPQPAPAWSGIRTCDAFAPMAMQQESSPLYRSLTQLLGTHDYIFSLWDNYRAPMSEDCLYLNIWAPAGADDEPLPVLFFIHGGSLMTGQSFHSEYRGEDLARRGIVVVNCAYRLGVFGYYAHEALAAQSENGTTGNYGLLDQIAALQWVKENISAFGGDPERITIAGESAGSSSVNALCVSPLSEGLFRYAIGESSGIAVRHPYHTFRSMDQALEMGKKILAEMDCDDVEALRALPAEQLVRTAYQNSAMTVDGYAITEQPYLTYEKGKNHEQALLNGFNAKEADAFLLGARATAENYPTLLRAVAGDFAPQLAQLVPPGAVSRDQRFIIDAGGEAKGSLAHVFSGAWFTYSHHLWSNYVTGQERPVYEYYFTKTNAALSNYHAGELPYAYGNLWRHGRLYGEEDRALSQLMQQYWVNFVKTGDPNGAGLPLWERRSAESERLLELGETVGMIEDPYLPLYPVFDRYMNQKDLETIP